MTCKDCFHYAACHRQGKEIPAEACATFKDRRLILEMPCEMGGSIWLIVTKRQKWDAPEYSFIKRSQLSWLNLPRVLRDFGRTVFLTKEEAEAALSAGIPKPSASAASAAPAPCVHYPDNPDMVGCRLLKERMCETRGACKFYYYTNQNDSNCQ